MARNTENPGPAQRAAKKARINSTPIKNATPSSSRPTVARSVAAEQTTMSAKEKGKAKAEAKDYDRTHQNRTASSEKTKLKTAAVEAPSTNLPSTFKVIAGSYEKLLYGLEGTVTVDDRGQCQYHLKPIFAFPAHVSCIKAVAASPNGGKWLATGSADEIIKIWDLRRRKEVGGLMHHEGSITCLDFLSRSHLLSGSEDGSLCLFHARDWTVLRALKGHKGRVNSVAVHPSRKVALSVGKDRALRMWDLMRGKGCASTKLGKEGEIVRFSIDGSMFVVQAGSTIDVYDTSMTLRHTINHPSRIQDVRYCKPTTGKGDLLLVAAEDKKVLIYKMPADSQKAPAIIAAMVGHSNRVKAVELLDIALPSPSSRTSTTIACTASSDGKIHLYDMAAVPQDDISPSAEPPEIGPSAEYDTKRTRLTCVALADGEPTDQAGRVNGKRKRNDASDTEGAASDDENDDFDAEGSDEASGVEESEGEAEEEGESEQVEELEEEGENV